MILDVGCGIAARGDVNVDLEIDSTHRRGGQGPLINTKETKNFIIADGQKLPLRNRLFTKVVSYQVIEHVPNPYSFLKEMYRVAIYEVYIECPHRAWLTPFNLRRPKTHISNFNLKWFKTVIPKLLGTWNFEVKVDFRGYPSKFLSIILWPRLIRVRIIKEIENTVLKTIPTMKENSK